MNATEKKKNAQEETPGEDQNIDKIRDILFGVQVRDFEERFERIEKHFEKEIAGMRDENRKKLAEIEEFLNREVSALTESISNEQKSREENVKKLSEDLRETSHEFGRKMTDLDEKTAKSEEEIRQTIADESKSLTEDLERRREEILGKLDTETERLRGDKADRGALVEIFAEMAMRLADEHRMPDEEPRSGEKVSKE